MRFKNIIVSLSAMIPILRFHRLMNHSRLVFWSSGRPRKVAGLRVASWEQWDSRNLLIITKDLVIHSMTW